MRKYLFGLASLLLLYGAAHPSVSYAELPALGVQQDFFTEHARIACDTLEQVKILYEAGKDNAFLIHPKFDEVNKQGGVSPNGGGPVCVSAKYPGVTVLETQDLGPLQNPIGETKLEVYGVKVDTSSVQGVPLFTFWVFYIDAAGTMPAPSSYGPPSGRDSDFRYIVLPPHFSLLRELFL